MRPRTVRLWPAAPARGNPGRSRAPRPPRPLQFRVGAAGRARSPPTEEEPEPDRGRPSGRSQAGGRRPREHGAHSRPPANGRPSRVRSSAEPLGAGRCPSSEVGRGASPEPGPEDLPPSVGTRQVVLSGAQVIGLLSFVTFVLVSRNKLVGPSLAFIASDPAIVVDWSSPLYSSFTRLDKHRGPIRPFRNLFH